MARPTLTIADALMYYSEWLDGEKLFDFHSADDRTHEQLAEQFIQHWNKNSRRAKLPDAPDESTPTHVGVFDELPTKATLGEFYKWLEHQGYIDEEVRHSELTREKAVGVFINSWPEDKIPLAGTLRQRKLEAEADDAARTTEARGSISIQSPEFPSPDSLLARAHAHMDAAKMLSDAPSFQGKKPKRDGKSEMEHMVITENLSLLAIAGYLRNILEVADGEEP